MPLPRYHRLPADAQTALLAVARTHFARDGKDAASFNRIIAEAGISKTSAYHYFDGKEDLFAAVLEDTAARTLAALGPWTAVDTPAALWEQVGTGTRRLLAHLREHPDDRALLAAGRHGSQDPGPWIRDLVGNGLRIGAIAPDPDPELTTAATQGVFDALDTWALSHPDRPEDELADALVVLLSRLWNAPA
ncbi:TetR/AcrR family transcriptional regulator [Streptomyces sp. NPDC048603]|uniref:TetR/AcrR family transcriptional regulator n=1 Tax=Streptomyces sp. NPDC048603 TaxID=3365577 RepID=UPI003716F36E